MITHTTVVGGRGGATGRGERGAFHTYIQQLAEKHKTGIRTQLRNEAEKLVARLAMTTPVDTGAASGRSDRPRTGLGGGPSTPITPKHPAYGMTIGNQPFNSGWQIRFSNTSDTGTITVSIVSPLWEKYVHYLEFISERYKHFVLAAWQEHMKERKSFQRKNK